jgi:hypothetical protein
MIASKEFIKHEADNDEAWICLCGNQPHYDGFFPCDKNGNEMVPAEGWQDLYVCTRCGRIIDQNTLEVIGKNPNFVLLP